MRPSGAAITETFAREIADCVPIIVWTHDAAGVPTYFNRRWTEYTGASFEETLAAGPESFVHPDDRGRLAERFAEARSTGQPFDVLYRLRGHDGAYRTHEARIVPVRGTGSDVALWVGTATDIDERERTDAEQRYLARASAVLGTSLEMQRTLADVAQMLVPSLADWCSIDLLRDDGKLDRAAVAHVDPSKVALAWELWKRLPPDPHAPQGPYAVMAARKPDLVEVTDEMLVAAVQDLEVLAIVRGLGLRWAITVPLLARDRVLGALALVTAESGKAYGARDVAFAEEVGRRISIAIDNARLYEEATIARRAAEAIADDVRDQCKAIEDELLRIRGERDAGASSRRPCGLSGRRASRARTTSMRSRAPSRTGAASRAPSAGSSR